MKKILLIVLALTFATTTAFTAFSGKENINETPNAQVNVLCFSTHATTDIGFDTYDWNQQTITHNTVQEEDFVGGDRVIGGIATNGFRKISVDTLWMSKIRGKLSEAGRSFRPIHTYGRKADGILWNWYDLQTLDYVSTFNHGINNPNGWLKKSVVDPNYDNRFIDYVGITKAMPTLVTFGGSWMNQKICLYGGFTEWMVAKKTLNNNISGLQDVIGGDSGYSFDGPVIAEWDLS